MKFFKEYEYFINEKYNFDDMNLIADKILKFILDKKDLIFDSIFKDNYYYKLFIDSIQILKYDVLIDISFYIGSDKDITYGNEKGILKLLDISLDYCSADITIDLPIMNSLKDFESYLKTNYTNLEYIVKHELQHFYKYMLDYLSNKSNLKRLANNRSNFTNLSNVIKDEEIYFVNFLYSLYLGEEFVANKNVIKDLTLKDSYYIKIYKEYVDFTKEDFRNKFLSSIDKSKIDKIKKQKEKMVIKINNSLKSKEITRDNLEDFRDALIIKNKYDFSKPFIDQFVKNTINKSIDEFIEIIYNRFQYFKKIIKENEINQS